MALTEVMLLMPTALDKLKRLVPPPAHPVNADGPWARFEKALGTSFPSDFKACISMYGDGEFGGFLMLWNPLAYPNPKAWMRDLEIYLEADREARTNCPDEYAGAVFPEPGGRLPWARTGNGDVLWWQTKGKPDSWTTIVWETRGPDHEYFNATTTEFLYGWLSRKIKTKVITDHFLKEAGPVFAPSQPSP